MDTLILIFTVILKNLAYFMGLLTRGKKIQLQN